VLCRLLKILPWSKLTCLSASCSSDQRGHVFEASAGSTTSGDNAGKGRKGSAKTHPANSHEARGAPTIATTVRRGAMAESFALSLLPGGLAYCANGPIEFAPLTMRHHPFPRFTEPHAVPGHWPWSAVSTFDRGEQAQPRVTPAATTARDRSVCTGFVTVAQPGSRPLDMATPHLFWVLPTSATNRTTSTQIVGVWEPSTLDSPQPLSHVETAGIEPRQRR